MKTTTNIPISDIECWTKYTKFRWVYESTRLLDAQSIAWSPVPTDTLTHSVPYLTLADISDAGSIYIEPAQITLKAEAYVTRGDIKHIRYYDSATEHGGIELRINAFVALYFKKFTGVIGFEIADTKFLRIQLRPFDIPKQNSELVEIKLLRKIYKNEQVTYKGSGVPEPELRDIITS